MMIFITKNSTMKNIWSSITGILLALFALSACHSEVPSQNNTPNTPADEATRNLTITASMDESLRLSIVGHKMPTFQKGDKIYPYVVMSDGSIRILPETTITRIENVSGMPKARFQVQVPEGAKSLLCSVIPLEMSSDRFELSFPGTTAFELQESFTDIPAVLTKELNGSEDNFVANFEMRGSLMRCEVENKSDDVMSGVVEWSAMSKEDPSITYAQQYPRILFASPGKEVIGTPHAQKPAKKVTIQPGEKKTLYTYIFPHQEMVPSQLKMHFTPDGGAKLSTAGKEKKTNTPWGIKKNIRLLNVVYKGAGNWAWYATEGGASEKPLTPAMKFTMYSSASRVIFGIYTKEEFASDVWYDKDNNGKYDLGEEIPLANYSISSYAPYYPMSSKGYDLSLRRNTYNLYGKITHFRCDARSIERLVLEGDHSNLVYLNVMSNSIKKTDMENIIQALPNLAEKGLEGAFVPKNAGASMFSPDNNEITKTQIQALKAKGWKVYKRAQPSESNILEETDTKLVLQE